MRVVFFTHALCRIAAFCGCLLLLGLREQRVQGIAGEVSLSAPMIVSNTVSFFFDSATNQLLSVQSSSALASDWETAAQFQGTGTPLSFNTVVSADRRLFRVKVSQLPPT